MCCGNPFNLILKAKLGPDIPKKTNPCKCSTYKGLFVIWVVRLGLEPRLFCTKNRRVANYTIGQFSQALFDCGWQK